MRWRFKGSVAYTIYYTPPHVPGADKKTCVIGVIKNPVQGVYLVQGEDHPVLRSKSQAVWWLYNARVGLRLAEDG